MAAVGVAVPAPLRPLDRLLRLFTDVRPGESGTALLLTLNIFLILTAYYLIKPVREALILAGGGAEVKSYAAAGQAVLLLGAVPLYGVLAGRLPRRRLINTVTWFFVACLALFYALAQLRVPIGVVFFLWVGIFNMMVVAQFWSFANDVYTTDEGQRLFPVVAFGGSTGAVLGSFVAGRLMASWGVSAPLLIAGALLLLGIALSNLVDERERRRTETPRPATPTTAEKPAATGEFRVLSGELRHLRAAPKPAPEHVAGAGGNAFALVLRNRYLLLIALLMLFLNWVNTTGEYILGRTVAQAAADAVAAGRSGGLNEGQFIGRYYSNFLSVVNLAGLLLQLFVVSRVIKYLGLRVAIAVLPILAFAGYALLAFYPVLVAIRWAKTVENATDYSLQNTVRQALFLPTTREQKYKAKQAIDSFFVRTGDVLSAGLVFLGTTLLALETRGFALVNLALVAGWFVLALAVGRRYQRLAAQTAA